ncbi:MAG: alpha/beta hydrolase, partial [Acidobacteriota bacterium]
MPKLTHTAATDLFRQKPHDYLDVGAGHFAYRRVGDGPDALFVHGWPVSGATFRGLLPYLAPHVTCHVVDLVGAGQSRFDRSTPISVEQQIKNVRRAVDLLGLEDLAVVGHDSGGLIARHALAGDRRLRATALINTEQSRGLSLRFRQFLLASRLPRFMDLLAWAALRPALRRNPLLLGDLFADRNLIGGEFEEFFLAPLRDDLDLRWAAGQLLGSFETRWVEELGELHRAITTPVTLVWGEEDVFFPLAWAREMVD